MTIRNIAMMNYSYRNMMTGSVNSANGINKLSSGYRVNSAADAAAGLAVSERMRGQVRGLDMAYRNTQNGLQLANTAEGNLSSSSDILVRMRELAVQAADGTMGDTERGFLNDEAATLMRELDRISGSTNYNGINLLDGSLGSPQGDAGVRAMGINNISVSNNTSLSGDARFNVSRGSDGAVSITASIGGETITNEFSADDVSTGVTFEFSGGNISLNFSSVGSLQEGALSNVRVNEGENGRVNTANAASNIQSSQMTFQAGANGSQDQQISMRIGDMSSEGLGLSGVDLSTREGANAAIAAIDRAANIVSDQRGSIGATQNRLEHTMNNIGVSSENLAASESRIRDLDMAYEAMQNTRNNIMLQASQAMMSQAMNLSRQHMLGMILR